MSGSESRSAAADFADIVAMLMTEPRPVLHALRPLTKSSEWPIDEARLVFTAAVEYVLARNSYDAVADWERRQAKLSGWLEVLHREPAPMSDEQFAAATVASGSVNRIDLEAVLMGTRHAAALLDDVAEVTAAQQRRCEQAERVDRAVALGRERVAGIMTRCVERHAEISAATEARLEAISHEDTAAREAVIESGYQELIVLSETACEQIHAQTRRVLDAHRRTAAMPIWQFWEFAHRSIIKG